jgi:hypothetical protein
MTTPQVLNPRHIQREWPGQAQDVSQQNDEVQAWEPLGDDLWLPHRIRGSWRGGVLG